ncbi:MAG: glycosyltransferase [Promethearchaeota archaeon]
MKILFVGYFFPPWSSHHPFVKYLRKNHYVDTFDFRYVKNSRAQNFLLYQKLNAFLNNSLYPLLSKSFKTFKFYINGYWRKNRELLDKVKNNRYDLVILSKADSINYKIIPKLNKYTKTFYYFMDQLSNAIRLNAHRYAAMSTWSSASFSDVTQLFRREGANCYHMIEGFNDEIFKPSKNKVAKEFDVIFAGSISSKRENYINFLRKNRVNVICFGNGWDNDPIYLEKLSDTYNKSKIVLNFTRGKIGISDRVVFVLGTNSFLISEYCHDIEKFFEKGIHLEWFKTKSDLLNLINFYLKNDEIREKIAKQASKYVFENYTWEKYFDKFLKFSKINQ